jgi:hypothetical protein
MKKFIFSKKMLFLCFVAAIASAFSQTQTTANTSFSFSRKVTISQSGQVKGFPVQDVVTHEYVPISDNQVRVYLTMSRANYNPYQFSSSYALQKLNNGTVLAELGCLLHPQEFTAPNNATISYTGAALDYPATLSVGQTLNQVEGGIVIQNNQNFRKELAITVKDRKIIEKQTLRIAGASYDAFVLAYQIEIRRSFNGELFETSQHQVKEWLVPNVGIVKRAETAVHQTNSPEGAVEYQIQFDTSAEQITFP